MLEFIKRNFFQIIDGGYNILLIKLLKFFKLFLLFLYYFPSFIFFGIPFILISKILSFFILIRVQEILSSRIGHFAGNVDLYLEEKKNKINCKNSKIKCLDIFFLDAQKISNIYILSLWKKKIHILPRYFFYPIYFFFKLINLNSNIVGNNIQQDRDVLNLLESADPNLVIPYHDKKIGKDYLRRIGMKENQKIVCLNVRDSAYLPGLDYHNYRDGDIKDYILTAEMLANKGYAVFRMGKKVNQKLLSKNPNIIDYANTSERSDFLDVFIASECEFCISTSSGFDALCTIFRKPIAFITVPIGYIYTFNKKYISITKHHLDITTNKKLSIKEIQKRDCLYALDSTQYNKKNIQLISNTKNEILDLAYEMINLIENNFKRPISKNEKIFWNIFKKNSSEFKIGGFGLHGQLKSFMSESFLNNNEYLIKDE